MSANTPRKSTQLSTTVSPETFEALREYRFANRIEKMTDIVADALAEYMANHGIVVTPTDSGE